MERFTVSADDGFALAAVRWLPRTPPRAVLQLAHGMSEHAARYAPFADACAAAGIAVYGHDHRGHGGSTNDATPRGHYADQDGWAKVTGDLDVVHRHIRSQHPELPQFLFGHSMGLIPQPCSPLDPRRHAGRRDPQRHGWRMGVGHRLLQWVARRQVRSRGTRAPSPLMAGLVFGTFNLRFAPWRTAFEWLSRDAAQVAAYKADPLCGFVCSGQLWVDLLGGIRALEAHEDQPERLAPGLPLLLIAGSHDPVSLGGFGNGQVAARYRAAGNEQVTERRYSGARHELINETNRSEVWQDLIGWMELVLREQHL